MSVVPSERRRSRSERPAEALGLQLAHLLRQGHLDALVLANEEGLVVAHAGDAEVCRELAALAPLLSRPELTPRGPATQGHGMLHIRKLSYQGCSLYLASSQGRIGEQITAEADQLLSHASTGVARILAA